MPGGITFSDSATAIPSVMGTISRWSVQATGGTTYQSAYAMYPASPDAPAVTLGINKFLSRYLATLHHEGSLLDSINLVKFYVPYTSFLDNGNSLGDHLALEVTRLRTITVKGFSIRSIASFHENEPSTGFDLIGVNVIRSSLNHGVPRIDDCYITFECGSDGSNCLEYGNQRIASFMLRSYEESDYTGPTPTLSSILSAGGLAPLGTVSDYIINDSLGDYFNNATITPGPTKVIKIKPFHNIPPSTLDFDPFRTSPIPFTSPVPSSDRFSVEIDPVTGTPQTFMTCPPPSTTESLKLLSPTSFNTGDFFGKTVKFTYALPSSFLVNSQFAGGIECTADKTNTLSSIPSVISPGATSVKFKTDKLFDGEPVTGAGYMISLRALDGPEIKAKYFVGTTCTF